MSSQVDSTKQAIDIAIRLGVVGLIAYGCYLILKPFLLPVAWAIIVAVAVYPLHLRLEAAFGGRSKLALTVFTLLGLGLLIAPTVMLASSAGEGFNAAREAYAAGTLRVPAPPVGVADWPLIGTTVHEAWAAASSNLTETLQKYSAHFARLLAPALSSVASAGVMVFHFVISVLIAAVLMANADAGRRLAHAIGRRLASDSGVAFVDLATATTRSVAQGVIGVALIQAVLSGIGMLAVGVPAAGVWALLVLVLAVVQLPPLVILGPVMVYVFSVHDTVPAVLFLVWGFAVSASDTFLKPIFLGRGLDIPMLVILVGAIGGMLLAGVIGLFVGAVTLALAYKLFAAWLDERPQADTHT